MQYRLTDIWKEFSGELSSFIKSRASENDVDDILQEVFIKIQLNLESLNDIKKLKSWIYTITRNTIIDFYRRKSDISTDIKKLEETLEPDDDRNMNDKIGKCIGRMLSELPIKYQEIVRLYDINNLKHKEIAEKLSISISCSKMRLKRAREKLKNIMFDCCDFELDSFGNILDYKQKIIKCKSCGSKCP